MSNNGLGRSKKKRILAMKTECYGWQEGRKGDRQSFCRLFEREMLLNGSRWFHFKRQVIILVFDFDAS